MAKYLRPRRGTRTNAVGQNILLKRGEIFLEFPGNSIGNTAGKLIVGDGATSYQNIDSFIEDPSLYCPRFNNSTYQTSNYTFNTGTAAIDNMGDGSSTSNISLPNIIGYIKEALCKQNDSNNYMNTELAKYANNTTATTTNNGLVPKSGGGDTKYLRADGTWQVPPNDDTTYGYPNSTRNGLCRAFQDGITYRFLRADNTWATPPNTTYAVADFENAGLLPTLNGSSDLFLRASRTWAALPPTTASIFNTTAVFPFSGYSSTAPASEKTIHQCYQEINNVWFWGENVTTSATVPANSYTLVQFNKSYSGWTMFGIFGFNTGNQNVVLDGINGQSENSFYVWNLTNSAITTTITAQILYTKNYNTT